ncbi:hypothetical protein LCGC14_0984490 [marine sediment metagenome]|uniref:Uncharacterized protein n=1 Tax=marine sediment metagenome TaxID=412755 RepID=A0A0F9NC72_9ZZZZ
MNLEEAVTIVARWSLLGAYDAWTDDGWEMLPEINEPDYERVVERMGELLMSDVTLEQVDAAYKFLEARATDEEEDSDE